MQYYAVEPWGAYRDNLHTGILASVIANANRKKTAKPFKPGDFMLRTKAEQRAMDTSKSLRYLRAVGRRKQDGG